MRRRVNRHAARAAYRICQFELKTVGSACITAKSAALTVESLPTFGYNLGINNLWAGAVEGAVSKVVPKVHAK